MRKSIDGATEFKNIVLTILRLAEKYKLHGLVQEITDKRFHLKSFSDMKSTQFKALSKLMQYEILRDSVIDLGNSNDFKMEIEIIFNFFGLILVENRVADVAIKKKSYLNHRSQDHLIDLDSISCDESSDNCTTLVIEQKEIRINTFVLTNNSPVFKVMLESRSFKEGQNMTVELPGKKMTDVAYFLQFLHSQQEINGIPLLALIPC